MKQSTEGNTEAMLKKLQDLKQRMESYKNQEKHEQLKKQQYHHMNQ